MYSDDIAYIQTECVIVTNEINRLIKRRLDMVLNIIRLRFKQKYNASSNVVSILANDFDDAITKETFAKYKEDIKYMVNTDEDILFTVSDLDLDDNGYINFYP